MVYFCPWRFLLIFANSEDPDEMQHCAAFHLGLQCLQEYPFRGFQYAKGRRVLKSSKNLTIAEVLNCEIDVLV